jgi:hypothetical protein
MGVYVSHTRPGTKFVTPAINFALVEESGEV